MGDPHFGCKGRVPHISFSRKADILIPSDIVARNPKIDFSVIITVIVIESAQIPSVTFHARMHSISRIQLTGFIGPAIGPGAIVWYGGLIYCAMLFKVQRIAWNTAPTDRGIKERILKKAIAQHAICIAKFYIYPAANAKLGLQICNIIRFIESCIPVLTGKN